MGVAVERGEAGVRQVAARARAARRGRGVEHELEEVDPPHQLVVDHPLRLGHGGPRVEGGEALAAVSVDGVIDGAVRARLLSLPDITSATVVPLAELDPGGERAWL